MQNFDVAQKLAENANISETLLKIHCFKLINFANLDGKLLESKLCCRLQHKRLLRFLATTRIFCFQNFEKLPHIIF